MTIMINLKYQPAHWSITKITTFCQIKDYLLFENQVETEYKTRHIFTAKAAHGLRLTNTSSHYISHYIRL